MEDEDLLVNLDWDPLYLRSIFDINFNDMSDLWNCDSISDSDLLQMFSTSEIYSPITEDITIEDHVLLKAVSQIESE